MESVASSEKTNKNGDALNEQIKKKISDDIKVSTDINYSDSIQIIENEISQIKEMAEECIINLDEAINVDYYFQEIPKGKKKQYERISSELSYQISGYHNNLRDIFPQISKGGNEQSIEIIEKLFQESDNLGFELILSRGKNDYASIKETIQQYIRKLIECLHYFSDQTIKDEHSQFMKITKELLRELNDYFRKINYLSIEKTTNENKQHKEIENSSKSSNVNQLMEIDEKITKKVEPHPERITTWNKVSLNDINVYNTKTLLYFPEQRIKDEHEQIKNIAKLLYKELDEYIKYMRKYVYVYKETQNKRLSEMLISDIIQDIHKLYNLINNTNDFSRQRTRDEYIQIKQLTNDLIKKLIRYSRTINYSLDQPIKDIHSQIKRKTEELIKRLYEYLLKINPEIMIIEKFTQNKQMTEDLICHIDKYLKDISFPKKNHKGKNMQNKVIEIINSIYKCNRELNTYVSCMDEYSMEEFKHSYEYNKEKIEELTQKISEYLNNIDSSEQAIKDEHVKTKKITEELFIKLINYYINIYGFSRKPIECDNNKLINYIKQRPKIQNLLNRFKTFTFLEFTAIISISFVSFLFGLILKDPNSENLIIYIPTICVIISYWLPSHSPEYEKININLSGYIKLIWQWFISMIHLKEINKSSKNE